MGEYLPQLEHAGARISWSVVERIAGLVHPPAQAPLETIPDVGELRLARQIAHLEWIAIAVEQPRAVLVPVPAGVGPAFASHAAPETDPRPAVRPARSEDLQVDRVGERPFLTEQGVCQAPALHVRRHLHSADFKQGGHDVHAAHQRRGPRSRGHSSRKSCDERYVDRLLVGCRLGRVEGVVQRRTRPVRNFGSRVELLAVAVAAEMVPVIGGEHDQGVLGQMQPVECFHQPAELGVQGAYAAVVLGDFPSGEFGHPLGNVGSQLDGRRIVAVVLRWVLLVWPVRRPETQDQEQRAIGPGSPVGLEKTDRQGGLFLRGPSVDGDGAALVLEVRHPVVVVFRVVGRHVVEAMARFLGIGWVAEVPLADEACVIAGTFQGLGQRGLAGT